MKLTSRLFLTSLIVAAALAITFAPLTQQAAVAPPANPGQAQMRLPIYRLSPPQVNEDRIRALGKSTFGIAEGTKRDGDMMSMQSGTKVVEVDARSGAIWMADQAELWNPDAKPQLPDEKRARAIADQFLSQNKLLMQTGQDTYLRTTFSNTESTRAVRYEVATRKRDVRKLDVQVNYSTKINVPAMKMELPVIGGGGDFSVTLGDQGKLIGFQGLQRNIEAVETESPVIPKERVDAEFRKMAGNLKLRSVKSELAYYSEPTGVEQKFLYPVYVYRATALIENEVVPLRIVTIPATEFGPKRPEPQRLRQRAPNETPTRRSTEPEDETERKSGYQNHSVRLPLSPAPEAGAAREGGSSFIGLSGGLAGSQPNAQGFVNGLSADGWSINFLWGDANAFESDWRRNDDTWVDAADFVFYTGHANMNGWVLSNPDDTFMHFNEVGASPQTGDIWGFQDLEWAIVAACGPLQDNAISPGGGDVFARWDGAFDGLHQLLGYGAITFDNTLEGSRVVQYARGGATVKDAWFRAAKEIQPATNGAAAPDGPIIWVGVMYVGKAGADPGNDHIWGHGSVSADPTSPTYYVAIWSPC